MSDGPRSLIARFIAGEAVHSELRNACRQDPAVLKELCDQLMVDRFLERHGLDRDLDEEDFVEEVAARLSENFKEEPFVAETIESIRVRRNRIRWTRFSVVSAAAAILALGIFVLSPLKTDTNFVAFATVIAVEASESLAPSARVGNRPILIDGGFAQLRFDHGTVLLVEGPARFCIVSEKRVEMEYGRAVATVSEAGHGFVIESPHAEIVDYGTQFGVKIDPRLNTEVHVMSGEVRARAIGDTEFVTLFGDQALRLVGDGQANERFNAEAEQFLLELPEKESDRPGNYLHWSFDEGQGSETRPVGRGIDPGSGLGILKNEFKDASTELPEWAPGVFGSALFFGGNGESVVTDFSGISGAEARTVGFWVKASPDDHPGYAAIGWGAREEGGVWQVSLNPADDEGVLGGLRLGILHGSVIGEFDLRDNRWRHVAIVMYSGRKELPANLRTHVLLYVDGELVRASRRSLQGIYTQTASSTASSLVFGRNAVGKKAFGNSFRGSLDEIFVVDKALSQSEIQRLMSTNEL